LVNFEEIAPRADAPECTASTAEKFDVTTVWIVAHRFEGGVDPP
jgi:hypothetical protein